MPQLLVVGNVRKHWWGTSAVAGERCQSLSAHAGAPAGIPTSTRGIPLRLAPGSRRPPISQPARVHLSFAGLFRGVMQRRALPSLRPHLALSRALSLFLSFSPSVALSLTLSLSNQTSAGTCPSLSLSLSLARARARSNFSRDMSHSG